MAKNKKHTQEDEEIGFKRIKEQRKPIKNFKTHLLETAHKYLDDGDYDEDGIRDWKRSQS